MNEFNLRDIITEFAHLLEDDELPSPQTLYEIYAKRPANERRLITFSRLVSLLRKLDLGTFTALSLEEKERHLVSAFFSQ